MRGELILGERIRAARKKKGLTQTELGNAVGVEIKTIHRWEKGERTPRVEELKRLAQALNVNINELLNGTPEENWTLEIKLSTDLNRKDVIDMRNNNCVSNLNLTPNGSALTLSGGYSIFEDDDKFEDFINQLREARNFVIESGRKMVEFGNGGAK